MKSKILLFLFVSFILTQKTFAQEELLKKGNKVFVKASDNAVIIHGQDALRKWGYWQLTDKIEEANLIANFKVRQSGLAFDCHIEIINPKTNDVIIVTKGTASYASDVFNPKKDAIEKNVQQKLIPLVKGGNGK